jgi:hypothetical protein
MKKVLAVVFVFLFGGCGYYHALDKRDLCGARLHVENDFWEGVTIRDEAGRLKVAPAGGVYRYWIENNKKSKELYKGFEEKYFGMYVTTGLGAGFIAPGVLMAIAGILGEEKLKPLILPGLASVAVGVGFEFWAFTFQDEAAKELEKSVEEYNKQCFQKWP